MKNLVAYSLISSTLLVGVPDLKADWDTWAAKTPIQSWESDASYVELYTIDSSTGNSTLRTTYGKTDSADGAIFGSNFAGALSHVDPSTGNPVWIFQDQAHIYNLKNNSWTVQTASDNWRDDYVKILSRPVIEANEDGSYTIGLGGKTSIKNNADGTIQIGTDENDIDITSDGLAIDGEPLITKKANGELHIGKNSWITKEEGGRQKVYAKDAAGSPIPIDYTNGTKLLINGRDVEQSINNVGALSAALTGLPTVPTDTTLACGFGTGTHGGDFAFAGGCASKLNETLSVNYAASMTMPGQDYAGDFEDAFSARAGFVWKLGKSNKPTMISMNTKEKMQEKINSLEEKNEKILSKNNTLENTVSTLMARLERLEKVALGESKSKDLATIQLPFFKKK